MKASILLPLAFGIFTKTSATPLGFDLLTNLCDGAVTLASTWMGEHKNVEMKTILCPHLYPEHNEMLLHAQSSSTNVCGANCATNCFNPSGGGPDPNDCHVIADALRYDSENIGNTFGIGTGSNNTVVMQYKSCKTFFTNQDSGSLVYCRDDWASLIDIVAPNCQATQNAHGGNCVANNQAWFVQVQST
jgi:hypothetical protein